ncbi:MAG: LON peptidase substrate-binding domain-containing protein, partial [Actinobacteria bacterium]|nr:LON peptidase substrate-binding domain-containing protein [Actinomycetota bacterium]
MPVTLPLFPLGTVLFPGVLLPLHIFEERYRQLVRDLQAGPQPGRFAVIAIRKGRETGDTGVSALYDVGCTATVRRVAGRGDGRYDLVTVGTQRFRLGELDRSRLYLQGQVEMLPEHIGGAAAARQAAQAVREAFRGYREALARRRLADAGGPGLPDEPVALSYAVAASMVLSLPDRQSLLAEPDAASR